MDVIALEISVVDGSARRAVDVDTCADLKVQQSQCSGGEGGRRGHLHRGEVIRDVVGAPKS